MTATLTSTDLANDCCPRCGDQLDRGETRAQEIERLQREIGQRQSRLHFLVLGDRSKGVTMATSSVNGMIDSITTEFSKRIGAKADEVSDS